jgi:hypothetical protein
VIRPRSDWTSTTSGCTTEFVPSEVDGVAVHWNGTWVTLSPDAQLRADRNFHVNTRGWCDIAYNLAVDQNGDVWVCRGLDLRSSANGSLDSNRRYVAVVALLGQNADGSAVQVPTPAMLDGLRKAVEIVRWKYPQATEIKTHNDVRPSATACPGPHLTAAVHNGALNPETSDMTEAQYQDLLTRVADIEAIVKGAFETPTDGQAGWVGANLVMIRTAIGQVKTAVDAIPAPSGDGASTEAIGDAVVDAIRDEFND